MEASQGETPSAPFTNPREIEEIPFQLERLDVIRIYRFKVRVLVPRRPCELGQNAQRPPIERLRLAQPVRGP
jgi:hypothetical protein